MSDFNDAFERVVRTEVWERNDGQRVVVDVRADETVVVAVPILHQIMTDLGYKPTTNRTEQQQ